MRELGWFPLYPHVPFYDLGLGGAEPEEFAGDFLSFYRRWGLRQLLTWDWPIPIDEGEGGDVWGDLPRLSRSGLQVFVPWYLLRGDDRCVQIIARRTANNCASISPARMGRSDARQFR